MKNNSTGETPTLYFDFLPKEASKLYMQVGMESILQPLGQNNRKHNSELKYKYKLDRYLVVEEK